MKNLFRHYVSESLGHETQKNRLPSRSSMSILSRMWLSKGNYLGEKTVLHEPHGFESRVHGSSGVEDLRGLWYDCFPRVRLLNVQCENRHSIYIASPTSKQVIESFLATVLITVLQNVRLFRQSNTSYLFLNLINFTSLV